MMKILNRWVMLVVCCAGLSVGALGSSGCSDDNTAASNNRGAWDVRDDSASGGEDAADATPQEDIREVKDATEPDVAEPDVAEPDATEPDATEPDATEPDVTEPDVTEPDAGEPCPQGQALCAGECVDLDSDPAHCGACGTVCGDKRSCVQGQCEARVCGGRAGDTCGDDEYCEFPEGTVCDYADGTGLCAPRPTQCLDVVDEVCGCDGVTYSNRCAANAAGTDVASEGACGGGSDVCDPQDVQSEGMCDMILGVFWNGNSCVYMSGCRCVGADCDQGYRTIEACQQAHRSCFDDCRNNGCPNATDRCMLCWATFACVPEGAAC